MNVKAQRMPRQAHRKERLNNQKKNRQANRIGSFAGSGTQML